MTQPKITRTVGGAMIIALVVYALVAKLAQPGPGQALFANCVQFIFQAIALIAIAWNARANHGHQRAFWILMAGGCLLWLMGQSMWMYYENIRREPVPIGYFGDLFFFLHIIPMIAATSLQPHTDPSAEERLGLGYIDFVMLTMWWVFLYAFFVGPWQYVVTNEKVFNSHYNTLYAIENLTLIGALAVLWLKTSQDWRKIYRHFYLAALVYAFSSLVINSAIDKNRYYTGSLYDIPLLISMMWFAYVGALAMELKPAPEPPLMNVQQQTYWHSRLASLAIASMPMFALYVLLKKDHAGFLDRYRLIVVAVSIVAMLALIFFKQRILDEKLMKLLRESREAYDNLEKLKDHVVQTEKLASIGRLVAGAAHEINNPLTAILGYSDLMASDERIDPANRGLAEKIRQQARRTKTLVSNLLAFAKQAPMQFHRVDLNSIVQNALQLRELDLASKKIATMADFSLSLPAVFGDENHLLRVCYQILNNAVDAMADQGGGTLTIATYAQEGNVVFTCEDTGPGIAEPERVFDPFYTTKEIGKGTGLGLSACYGIVRDHGGDIEAENKPGGGARFVVILPTAEARLKKEEQAPAGATRQ